MTNRLVGMLRGHVARWSGTTTTRNAPPIFVSTPPYSALSGGSKTMNLLAHKLLLLGYNAYATPKPQPGGRPPFEMRYLDDASQFKRPSANVVSIAIYPEVVVGNPLGSRFVARYLLNRSGLLLPAAVAEYGVEDIFLAFDPDHLPPGKIGVDLFMPLVDRRHYHPPTGQTERSGAVVFAHRRNADAIAAALPPWLLPVTIVSMSVPREPQTLAELYRGAACMIIGERSTAIYEALCCGCPVIGIPSDVFNATTYQRRFKGAGIAWTTTRDALLEATATLPQFIAKYDSLDASIDHRIQDVFDPIVRCAEDAVARCGKFESLIRHVVSRARSPS